MVLKTVEVTYGRKVNLGNFNNQHVEVSLGAELEDGDNEIQSISGLRQMARNHVMAELARTNKSLAKKTKNLPLGFAVDEDGVPYSISPAGRIYYGKKAELALENDLKQLDLKHN